jgi:hypothetical protein
METHKIFLKVVIDPLEMSLELIVFSKSNGIYWFELTR